MFTHLTIATEQVAPTGRGVPTAGDTLHRAGQAEREAERPSAPKESRYNGRILIQCYLLLVVHVVRVVVVIVVPCKIIRRLI